MPTADYPINDEGDEIEVKMEAWCVSCRCGMCRYVDAEYDKRSGRIVLSIEPCPECLEKARKDGYEEGHDEGYEEGHKIGYDEGERDMERYYTK